MGRGYSSPNSSGAGALRVDARKALMCDNGGEIANPTGYETVGAPNFGWTEGSAALVVTKTIAPAKGNNSPALRRTRPCLIATTPVASARLVTCQGCVNDNSPYVRLSNVTTAGARHRQRRQTKAILPPKSEFGLSIKIERWKMWADLYGDGEYQYSPRHSRFDHRRSRTGGVPLDRSTHPRRNPRSDHLRRYEPWSPRESSRDALAESGHLSPARHP